MDKAGKSYWNEHWQQVPHGTFLPDSTALRNYRDHALGQLIARALRGLPATATVLEAGCADSSVAVYLGKQGYNIVGVDYSPIGCEQFRQRAASEGLEVQVECCDIFSPPKSMLGIADCVVSYGLVEHFENTAACVQALRALARPGGRILTIIPNMRGAVGLLQRLCAPSVYAVHVPLTISQLVAAHGDCLRVTEFGYLLPSGFGVVNFHEPDASRMGLLMRRALVAGLGRFSWATWFMDRHVRLPRSQLLSPYCYCIAENR